MTQLSMERMASSSAIALGLAATAFAGDDADLGPMVTDDPVVEDSESILDAIWNVPVLYSNKENPFIQELKFIGRYQGQYVAVDSDQGTSDDWVTRRWRMGAQAKLFDRVTLKGEINVNDDFNPFYRTIEEAHLTYKVSDALKITVGKQKPKWSYEWSTSSREILPFERSLLVNQMLPFKSTGANASGKIDQWSYAVGIYSGDLDREFGGLDGGTFYLASLGFDFSDSVEQLDKSAWRIDYVYNDQKQGDVSRPYEHSFATSLVLDKDRFHTVTEFLYGTGISPDVAGFYFMPTYKITEKLELVTRYHYAHGSDDSLRISFGGRLRGEVPFLTDGGFGSDYHAGYAGLNYYIYGHKLKLMTGLEYASMDGGADGGDFDGWTWYGGIRLYF